MCGLIWDLPPFARSRPFRITSVTHQNLISWRSCFNKQWRGSFRHVAMLFIVMGAGSPVLCCPVCAPLKGQTPAGKVFFFFFRSVHRIAWRTTRSYSAKWQSSFHRLPFIFLCQFSCLYVRFTSSAVSKRGIRDLDVLSVHQENAINDEFQSYCETHRPYLAWFLGNVLCRRALGSAMTLLLCFAMLIDSQKAFLKICE